MKNKRRDRLSVGGASIILIMLVLALSSFALLAIRSSVNEKKLAEKTARSVKEEYLTEAKAVDIYAKISELAEEGGFPGGLSEISEITGVEEGEDGSTVVKYSVENEKKTLHIELAVKEKETEILRWSTKTAEDAGLYEIQITD